MYFISTIFNNKPFYVMHKRMYPFHKVSEIVSAGFEWHVWHVMKSRTCDIWDVTWLFCHDTCLTKKTCLKSSARLNWFLACPSSCHLTLIRTSNVQAVQLKFGMTWKKTTRRGNAYLNRSDKSQLVICHTCLIYVILSCVAIVHRTSCSSSSNCHHARSPNWRLFIF